MLLYQKISLYRNGKYHAWHQFTYSLIHQTYPKRECIPNACLYEAMHISLHNHNMDGSISYKVGSIVNELASKQDSTTRVNKHDVLQSDWGIVFQYLR